MVSPAANAGLKVISGARCSVMPMTGSMASTPLTRSGRAAMDSHPDGPPAEWVTTMAGPMRSSSSARFSFSTAFVTVGPGSELAVC